MIRLIIEKLRDVSNFFRKKILYAGVKFSAKTVAEKEIIWKCRKNISVGEGSHIERCCRIAGGNGGKVIIGKHCCIAERTVIRSFAGIVDIGNHVLLNYGCILFGNGGISIGEDTKLGPYCVLAASNHKFDQSIPIRLQGNSSKGIHIGKDVWLGAHCVITDGAEIGDGCVIGAGAVVTGKLPPYTIAVGIPAKVIRKRLAEEVL